MDTETLLLTYWKAWQSHKDWKCTRALMQDDFYFDAGSFQTHSADALIELMKKGNPWREIVLLEMLVDGNQGAMVYEGIDSKSGKKMRIAEVLKVKENKVSTCISSISEFTNKA